MTKQQTTKKDFLFILLIITILSISLLSFPLILYAASKYGPGSTHDSVAYMYAAESLLKGDGLVYFGYDSPFVQWPPMYPFVLAIVKILCGDIPTGVKYLNCILFSLIIFLSGYWLYKKTESPLISILGSISVLISIPLVYVSKYIWSEPLFILFVLLFMIFIDDFLCGLSLKHLILGALFAALSFLTRYVGAIAIITGCILLLIRNGKIGRKIGETFIFGIISSLPTILWMIRNYLLVNTFTGGRNPAESTLKENMDMAFATIASWFAPDYSASLVYIMLILILLISIILIVFNLIIKKDKSEGYRTSIPLIFSIAYIVYLLVSASIADFDSINSRLMSPVFVPIIITALFTMHSFIMFIGGEKNNKKSKIKIIIMECVCTLMFFVWIINPLSSIIEDVKCSHEKGAGILSSDWWVNSEIINYVKNLPNSKKIYSNIPDAIYIHTGRKAYFTPKKEGLAIYGLDKFKETIENEGSAYIVWFNSDIIDDIYNVYDLENFFLLNEIEKFSTGTICEISGLRGIYSESN